MLINLDGLDDNLPYLIVDHYHKDAIQLKFITPDTWRHAMKKLFQGLLIFCLFMFPSTSVIAGITPGALDTGFNSNVDSYIYAVATQPDGKVIIGGNFTKVDGAFHNRISRLNADGSLDLGFNPGLGANSWVVGLAVQPDGKVLIGGIFTSLNGTPRSSIARLNADGSLDTSFNAGAIENSGGFNTWVFDIAVQPDGKILIGGEFFSVNGTQRSTIARLNADGSLDTSFNPGSGANNRVDSLVLQPDGKVLIGGRFTTFNGVTRNGIARLKNDGTLDTSFNPGSGADSWVQAVALQPDGRVLIGGQFVTFNGVPRSRIARLNPNGTLDTTFNPGSGANGEVNAIAVRNDGRILIGGGFSDVNGTILNNIASLNPDGSLDLGFDPGNGPDNWLKAVVIQPDGKVLIGGVFTKVNNISISNIARMNADGTLDTGFDTSPGPNGHVLSTAIHWDGKVIIGGNYTMVGAVSRNYIARLNADGTLDTNFDPGTGTNGLIEAVAIQEDGKVIIGGWFTKVNGVTRNYISRLNANGSLDTGFDPSIGPNFWVSAVALQPDGKVVIGGGFITVNGISRSGIARLNSDGSLDSSFSPGFGADNFVRTIALQPDGKVLIGGWFNTVNGITRKYIARLNADGTLDTSFDPGIGPNNWVESVAIQSDGKVLLAGSFTQVSGQPRNHIDRLNTNGSLDSSFQTSTGANDEIRVVTVQPDGKILIGGIFTQFTGVPINRFARLNFDGSLDTGFNPGTGANGPVRTIVAQVDGKVIIGGEFTQVNSTAQGYIARLNGATPPLFTSPLPSTPVQNYSSINHTFTASGFPLPSFHVSTGSLPTGLSLNPTSGLLSGTFTVDGTHNFTVTASNFVTPSDIQNISIVVEAGNSRQYVPLIIR